MIEIIPNLHPAVVHFPIVLTSAAVFFTVLGKIFNGWSYAPQCRMTGRWMLWGAALFALAAVMFGWLAFNSVTHDEPSHAAMILHRNWALGALTTLLVLTAWDVMRGRSGKLPSYGFLGLLAIAWLLVMSTAWHGAELVYRHGLGVMSLPATEWRGHDHDAMPVQGADMPHEDAHSHEGAANAGQPHDAEPVDKIPGTDGAGPAQKKSGHIHAPGTPPHKD